MLFNLFTNDTNSVQQPCELHANQGVKTIVRQLYHEVPRELFVSRVEAAIDEVHKAQRLNMDTRRVF